MHGYRLSLLTTVAILAVASLGYADQISINIIVDGRDVVTASASDKPNKGKVFDVGLTSTTDLGVTTFAFTSPLDLTTGLQGDSKILVWLDADDGYTLVQLLVNGFSVTPNFQGDTKGLPIQENWTGYSTNYVNSSGDISGYLDVKVSDHWNVPEPNSLLLLGAGLLSAPWLRARYRKRR